MDLHTSIVAGWPIWLLLACQGDQMDGLLEAGVDGVDNPADTTPRVVETTVLGALAGPFASVAPGQQDIGFHGTDLGVSFEHGGELRIIFGDTWSDAMGTPIGEPVDDAQGTIDLEALPDGDALEAHLDDQLDPAQPAWQRPALPVRYQLNGAGRVAPLELYRGGLQGTPVNFGEAKAVIAAFSNGRDGAFAIFRRDVAVACHDDGTCDDGFACDRDMGFCSNTPGEYRVACAVGSGRCLAGSCVPSASGVCQDRTSSVYAADDRDGRADAVIIEHEVGVADRTQPTRYYTRPWRTSKFTNAIAKTVRGFDPARANPDDNDYRRADGSDDGHAKVLLWGRPRTVGTGATGRDARLYFAYSDMPEYSDTGPVGFQPRYFAGTRDGRPQFSDDPADAVALDLGGEPRPEVERYDVVDRTAVIYLPSLKRWAMLYGGDFSAAILLAFAGPNFQRIRRAPEGSIHIRFARHPWGPWSPPEPALRAGNPLTVPPDPDSQYGPGGVLHHHACRQAECAPSGTASIFIPARDGFFYGPNILDPFTEEREDGNAVDLYWNVSTWNPYQVVLVRTRVARGP